MGKISFIQFGGTMAGVRSIHGIFIASKQARSKEARNYILRQVVYYTAPIVMTFGLMAIVVALAVGSGFDYETTAPILALGCFGSMIVLIASIFGLRSLWPDIELPPMEVVLAYNEDNMVCREDNTMLMRYMVGEEEVIHVAVKGITEIAEVRKLLKISYTSEDNSLYDFIAFMTRKEFDAVMSKCNFELDTRNDFKKFVATH